MPGNLIVFISQNAACLVAALCFIGLLGCIVGFALSYGSRPGEL
jgi:hypothetical protein